MRTLLSFLLLLVTSSSINAQKSYVTVTCNLLDDYYARLSGDIPTSMKAKYDYRDFPKGDSDLTYCWIGSLLNLLAKEGFSVEQMNTAYQYVSETSTKSRLYTTYLLSKPSNNSTSNVIQRVQDDDSEVYEVARYNLQGVPINESEKGIQIIVYSNFTTKTIIKE